MSVPNNPVEAVATGIRVATGISLDVACYGLETAFAIGESNHPPAEVTSEAMVAPSRVGDWNLYELADPMLDGTLVVIQSRLVYCRIRRKEGMQCNMSWTRELTRLVHTLSFPSIGILLYRRRAAKTCKVGTQVR